ncbi:MAG: L,D-transpeptidase family protein [Pseudomonadota bacterium]
MTRLPACFFAVLLLGSTYSAQAAWLADPEIAERRLIEVIDAVEAGAGDDAMELAASLAQDYPTFQLAQLVYADLLAAQGGAAVAISSSDRETLDHLRAEARARRSFASPEIEDSLVASNLIKLADTYRYALVFELEKSRLFVFENDNGVPRLSNHYYISIGKAGIDKHVEGDNKTPLGVYRVTNYLPDETLPELYGAGAYPINYPNSWDRLHGKTGYGIWLHGVPRSTYSRPPLDSEGCMVVSNINLEAIGRQIDVSHTPVVLTPTIQWLPVQEMQEIRDTVAARFARWRSDWTALDVDAYLSHYSTEFNNQKHDFASWSAHKRNVALGKTFVDVSADEVDVFLYPDSSSQKELIVVQFVQTYRSNNFNSVSRKQQFWQREIDGEWRIVYEGA